MRRTKRASKRTQHTAAEFGECYALAARRVLGKCRRHRNDLRNSPGPIEWHLNWESSIIQLRKIGHVLHKVDGARSEFIRKAAETAFGNLKNWRSERFSWFQWIDEERNLILKEDNSSVVYSLPEDGAEFVEPLVLINGQFDPGSMVISNFIRHWTFELEEIEIEARCEKRTRRFFESNRK